MRKAIYLTVDTYFYKLGLAQARHIAGMHQEIDVHLFVEKQLKSKDNTKSSRQEENLSIHLNHLTGAIPEELKISKSYPEIVYARLFVPFALKDYDRILYLDADTLVLQSCEPLFNTPGMESKAIAAVIDQNLEGIFNSGVLLINPELFIKYDIGSALSAYLGKFHKSIKFADQDFINHFFRGKTLELNPKWNYQFPYIKHGFDLFVPAVLHFTGRECPWQPSEWRGDEIFSEMFLNLARKSGYTLKDFPANRIDDEHHTLTKLRDKLRMKAWTLGRRKKIPPRKIDYFMRRRNILRQRILIAIEQGRYKLPEPRDRSKLDQEIKIGFGGINVYALFPRSLASNSGLLDEI